MFENPTRLAKMGEGKGGKGEEGKGSHSWADRNNVTYEYILMLNENIFILSYGFANTFFSKINLTVAL